MVSINIITPVLAQIPDGTAETVGRSGEGMDGGGWTIMGILLLFSLIAFFVFLDKWFSLHRSQVNVGALIEGLKRVLKRNGIVEAITLCDSTPGPAAHVLAAAILARQKGEKDLRTAIEDAALTEVPRLEGRLNILATIAHIAPLLGLVGTVWGLMGSFSKIETLGSYITAADITGSISTALYTTLFGLCLAIPCYIGYNYLVCRVRAIVLDMQKASSEIIDFFNSSNMETNMEPDDGGTPSDRNPA